MTKTVPILLAGAALALSACNGPKGSCEGTYNSYTSTLESSDFEAMYELLGEESKKKIPSVKKYAAILGDRWAGSKKFRFRPQSIVETGGVCIANGFMDYTIKKLGELPESTTDEYYSWTFHKAADGKWYIEQPGTEKIQSW